MLPLKIIFKSLLLGGGGRSSKSVSRGDCE
jgi:hypothetical protein